MPVPNSPIHLETHSIKTRAREIAIEAGFQPDFPDPVVQELARLQMLPRSSDRGLAEDLRQLLWSSIDEEQSRDLDQIEYVERLSDGKLRLLVGIADVDGLVTIGSALDRHAHLEGTSLYTGVATFPMLPDALSANLTSLTYGQDRLALVVELHVLETGEVSQSNLYPAWVTNRAKLAYSSTGAWLEGKGPMPAAVASTPNLEPQIRAQLVLAQRLNALRKTQGALSFAQAEPVPVLDGEELRGLTTRSHNLAQDIIESFMIAANVAMAEFLRNNHSLALRRVVRTPRRWDRIQEIASSYGVVLPATPDPKGLSAFLDQRRQVDPEHFPDLSLSIVKLLGPGEYAVEKPGAEQEGHFGLAAHDYTHSTAPNRRYADLVTQRLLKALTAHSSAPYSKEALMELAAHCTEREDAARKVERRMRKIMAANLLSHRVGELFEGIITGASPKGTYARLLDFPAEGRILRGEQGVDVGDKVAVRLISLDVRQGFIDFERLRPGQPRG
jgi:exoribonuclease-2